MRISDWSSDGCSSDLHQGKLGNTWSKRREISWRGWSVRTVGRKRALDPRIDLCAADLRGERNLGRLHRRRLQDGDRSQGFRQGIDRKSGGKGKIVSVRVDLGGRRSN